MIWNVAVSRIVSDVLANDVRYIDFPNPGHTLLLTFSFVQAYGHGGRSLLTK